ncbi:hypothetical protein C8F04DRAFT_1405213 [Mycena alexandri]|uniref:Uncharacterized protein n=1 Tax=Mycena alexandri TaxID=1745969 RepID=A0AAD6WRC1_9AGAR|nr:hypothetical protein C8F04DRAFT_1405213 [Mycena alexandri]
MAAPAPSPEPRESGSIGPQRGDIPYIADVGWAAHGARRQALGCSYTPSWAASRSYKSPSLRSRLGTDSTGRGPVLRTAACLEASRTPWLAPMRVERTCALPLPPRARRGSHPCAPSVLLPAPYSYPLAHAVARTHARRAYSDPRLTLTLSRTPWLAPMRAERTLTRALPYPLRTPWLAPMRRQAYPYARAYRLPDPTRSIMRRRAHGHGHQQSKGSSYLPFGLHPTSGGFVAQGPAGFTVATAHVQ